MKTSFMTKLGKFAGVLTAATFIMLIVCAMIAIVALTAKFMFWLFL